MSTPGDTRTHSIRIGANGFRNLHAASATAFPADALEALKQYATQFGMVEVDDTFNELPPPETFQHWATLVPDDFQFFLTVPRTVTHEQRLRHAEGSVARLTARARNLGAHLGGLIFRLPTGGIADRRRLESLLGTRERAATWLFDLAQTPWDTADIAECITEAGAFVRNHKPPEGRRNLALAQHYCVIGGSAQDRVISAMRLWAVHLNRLACAGAKVTVCCRRTTIGDPTDGARRLGLLLDELSVESGETRSAIR